MKERAPAPSHGGDRPRAARASAPDEVVPERTALRVEVIDEEGGLAALADDWRALLGHACNASVFLSWEWHRTWWEVFGERGERLHLVTVREGAALVGLLPLYRARTGLSGLVTLRLLGTGEAEADEVATEYGDVLASAARAPAVADAVVEHLAAFDGWDRVVVPCVLEDALLLAACRRRGALARLEEPAGLRYRVALESGEAGHMDRLGPSRAKRIARSRRALERDGGLVVEPIVESMTPASPCATAHGVRFEAALRELAALNHERQTSRARKSVFASERFRRFHATLGPRLLPGRSVDIVRYRLGTRSLAVLYCFHDAASTHYYQSGFALSGANRYMPLTVAHLIEMQRAREAGRRWYDLMRGRPPCYKDELGCETTPMFDLALYRTEAARDTARRWRRLRRRAGATLRQLRAA